MIPFVDLKPQYADLKDDIHKKINRVFDHGMYIQGPEVKECEQALSEFVGCKHTITCSSGTMALHMALIALDIKPGDEVITTPFTFIATAEVIALVGATPVFVDIDKDTYNIDPNKITQAITEKTKAIMPVSLYGLPADMDKINTIAQANNIPVIEDAAQSFGATYKGKKSCNLSELAATSFFPAKPLGTYGDGGAIFTNDDALAEKLEQVRNHGQSKRYYHPYVGINGRLDSLQCACLSVKLTRFPQEIVNRQKIAERYTQAFSELPIVTPTVPEGYESVWAQYTLRVKDRDSFQNRLKELEVPTAVHYPIPVSEQPAYKELSVTHDLSITTQAAQEVVSLPMYPDMPESIQEKVIDAVKQTLT